MNPKILLLLLPAFIFTNCSTSYKSGQTPDDVYYSPVKYNESKQDDDRDQAREETVRDYSITMSVRDRRWRDFNNEYDYNKSPYYYCNCKCGNTGYYYNPSYHPWPVYIPKAIAVNTRPRMVNLNTYHGLGNTATLPKANGNSINWTNTSTNYNNSNNGENTSRRKLTPSTSNSSSANSTRTYTPPTTTSSSGSSGSSKSSGSVSRPKRD